MVGFLMSGIIVAALGLGLSGFILYVIFNAMTGFREGFKEETEGLGRDGGKLTLSEGLMLYFRLRRKRGASDE